MNAKQWPLLTQPKETKKPIGLWIINAMAWSGGVCQLGVVAQGNVERLMQPIY